MTASLLTGDYIFRIPWIEIEFVLGGKILLNFQLIISSLWVFKFSGVEIDLYDILTIIFNRYWVGGGTHLKSSTACSLLKMINHFLVTFYLFVLNIIKI